MDLLDLGQSVSFLRILKSLVSIILSSEVKSREGLRHLWLAPRFVYELRSIAMREMFVDIVQDIVPPPQVPVPPTRANQYRMALTGTANQQQAAMCGHAFYS